MPWVPRRPRKKEIFAVLGYEWLKGNVQFIVQKLEGRPSRKLVCSKTVGFVLYVADLVASFFGTPLNMPPLIHGRREPKCNLCAISRRGAPSIQVCPFRQIDLVLGRS